MNGAELTLSVSELNEYVRRSLASDPILHGVKLRGEISNFKRHSSGHWYFTLKDEVASVNCAMFRQANLTVRFAPCDGQQVMLTGSAGLYPKTGQYQFYVDQMHSDGVGELYQRFEALKAKLMAQGLFDPAVKKQLPLLPRGIGVVTSKTGAVLHDIRTVSLRRNPSIPLYLYPSAVQGQDAEKELVKAICALDRMSDVDVIIIGRGGGSMEDLWPFNEEILARAIFKCQTPVVSAVGHETDFTIADFVADVRAATPSQAAELCVCQREELLGGIEASVAQMRRACENGLMLRLSQVQQLTGRLREQNPQQRLDKLDAARKLLIASLNSSAQRELALHQTRLAQLSSRLHSVGPDSVLNRGFALILKDGKPVTDAAQANTGDTLSIHMRGGALDATVNSVTRRETTWQPKP